MRLQNKKQIAGYLGVSESAINTLIAKNGIPFTKVGGSIRFITDSIDEWLKEKENVYN